MNTNFEDITAAYEDEAYITVSTDELKLKVLPFYNLPARKIAELYSKRNKDQQKFIKEIYSLIHISMKNPSKFKDEVYDSGLTYSGLIQFLNTWINISSLLQQYDTGLIDDNGNKTSREVLTNVDIIQNMIYSKLAKGEEVKTKMLIRYLCEQIRELAYNYNATAESKDIIYELNIAIPIGKETHDED